MQIPHHRTVIRQFEELSNNAWPALQSMQYDGWLLRFANGVTKRSNSVNMHYPSTLDPEEKITYCEELYLGKGITPCFKVTAISDPPLIDEILEKRGYFIHSTISFQTLGITSGNTRQNDSRSFLRETAMRETWIDDFIRMNNFEPARRETYTGIMRQVITPKCLVSLEDNGKTIGVGLGVCEGRYIGLFDLVVDPGYRKQGIGEGLVRSLVQWGAEQGAEVAYLQVLSDNLPAISLYKKLGFREIYTYWYRMQGKRG
jgi:ribosomal protein S18 acetylase RimI-like enzyme